MWWDDINSEHYAIYFKWAKNRLKLLLNQGVVCFGCSTPTQMQEPKASALVKPLSERVCNSPLEPICILTQTYTCNTRAERFTFCTHLSCMPVSVYVLSRVGVRKSLL